ncbi:MAG: FtsX-like permease family protein [Bacteroidota bacterium]
MNSQKDQNKAHPPHWANRFLEWYCADELLDEIQGDLLEVYEHRVRDKGLRKANWLFIKEVLLFFRPSSFKKKNPFENLPIMLSLFKSYFKTASRNLWKTKVLSSLNLIGLTAGFSVFLLIAFYLQYELSFDRYHENSDRIYRIVQKQEGNVFRGTDKFAVQSTGMGPALTENFPEVEVTTILRVNETLFTKGNDNFYESGVYSDEFIFDVFSFKVLEGDGPEALLEPGRVLLTESFVKKHYGTENPIGDILELQDEKTLEVVGIVKDPPKNSHFTFSFITSFKNLWYYKPGQWDNNSYYAYLLLQEGSTQETLEEKLITIDQKYIADKDEVIEKSMFFLQPLTDIHLHSRINFEIEPNGDMRYLYFFASIAFIILLIAAINYLNFAVADSERRSNEVGMRKVLGARRNQLIQQFLGESFLLTLLSFLLAILIVQILLPLVNQYLDQEIAFSLGKQLPFLGLLLLAVTLIGMGAGLYPAFFISKVAPVKALKGNIISIYKKSNGLRNVLVTGQFIAAIVLAIGSMVVFQQLKYVQNKRLGFDKDHVIFVPYSKNDEVAQKRAIIKERLLQNPHIKQVAFSLSVPINMANSGTVRNWEGKGPDDTFWAYRSPVDYDYMDLYDMEIIEGRGFSRDFPADSIQRYVLNERAVEVLGWDHPIGKSFNQGQVIGVVKNFHFQPFHLAIEPLYLRLVTNEDLSYRGIISLKVDGQSMESTLNYMQNSLKSILPSIPLEYQFFDEALNKMYVKERRLGRMFRIFTGLALLISLLGLLGLAYYNVIRRAKEISIRKVLGANTVNIIQLLSNDFVKLILLALVIATPLAYYMMQRWLESFVYRINLSWTTFALIGVIALILPVVVIGLQSMRSAQANPVDNLRA